MKCQCYLLQTARQALQDVKGIVTQLSLQGHLILVLATLTCSSSGRGRSWFPRGFLFSGSCGMSCDVLVTMVKKKNELFLWKKWLCPFAQWWQRQCSLREEPGNGSCGGRGAPPGGTSLPVPLLGSVKLETSYEAETWRVGVCCTTWCWRRWFRGY